MKEDLSEYEKTRRDAYAPLVERLSPKHTDKFFIYAISCGLGWRKIIFQLVEELDKIWGKEKWKLLQAKEKFGGLRFYVEHPDDEKKTDLGFEAIGRAEKAAWETCERCGAPGKTVTNGLRMATVCEPCDIRWKERKSQGTLDAIFG